MWHASMLADTYKNIKICVFCRFVDAGIQHTLHWIYTIWGKDGVKTMQQNMDSDQNSLQFEQSSTCDSTCLWYWQQVAMAAELTAQHYLSAASVLLLLVQRCEHKAHTNTYLIPFICAYMKIQALKQWLFSPLNTWHKGPLPNVA